MGKKLTKSKLKINGLGPFICCMALFVYLMFANNSFLTASNLTNVLRQSSLNGFIAVGMMVVIVTGGIDLSVGSVVAVCGGLAANLANCGLFVSILAALVLGAAFGFCNGILVAKFKITPLIATLATQMAIRGISYLYIGTTALTVNKDYTDFINFSKVNFLGIPLVTVIMFVCLLAFAFIFKYTSYGRNIYSTGGNEEAAKMMGLNCARVKIIAYMICGALAGFTGVILTSRLANALPLAGDGYELTAISTVVLGGVYLTGGRGRISGVFWAIMTMALLNNLFSMSKNMTIWLENFVMGVLLVVIVMLQSEEVHRLFGKIFKKILPKKENSSKKHTI